MKEQHTYTLTGLDINGDPARISADVVAFEDTDRYFTIIATGTSCTVHTPKGEYVLERRNGRYEGICNGYKTHVCLKKVIGKLHTWF